MSWTLAGHTVRSVLVSRLRYLGDIAMSTVLLEVLRRGDPELRLGYLCEQEYADILRGHPLLHQVHALASKRRGDAAHVRSAGVYRGGGTFSTVRELRRARYDLVVDLFFNPRSAGLLWATGIRHRIGGARGWRRCLYTHTAGRIADPVRSSAWLRASGALGDHLGRLTPLRHEETGLPFPEWFRHTYADAGPDTRIEAPPLTDPARSALVRLDLDPAAPFVLLAPGATWPVKEWPVEHWCRLAPRLRERTGMAVVVLAPPGRADDFDRLTETLGDAGGMLPVLPLASALEVVAAARLLVCVDGGIMHAAVAMGRPTVALFGATSTNIWFPYAGRGPFRVLSTRPACYPCNRHECDAFICLPDLEPDAVLAAVNELAPTWEGDS